MSYSEKINPDKHPCFQAIPFVDQVCREYFDPLHLNMNFFGHVTVYPNGKYHFLCSKPEWPEYSFIEEENPPAGFTIYDQVTDSVKLLNIRSADAAGWTDEEMRIAKDRFGITDGMLIYRKYEDHLQGFFFDLHNEKATEHYINHFNYFENFIHFYKDRLNKLLKKASDNKLMVNEAYLKPAEKTDENINVESLIKLPKQYHLMYQSKSYSISAREYQCLSLLAQGRKMKEIGQCLSISPRTVDTYLVNLKQKFNISNNSALITIFWKNQIQKPMII